MDTISISRLQQLHPKLRDKALEDYEKVSTGLKSGLLRITQGLRTIEEQDALYAQGRTAPGNIVTNAKGGSSLHNFGLAFDIVIIRDGKPDWATDTPDFKYVVEALKELGWEWGGDFHSIIDKPHFQITYGHSVHDLQSKYNSGDTFMDSGHKYVNL